VGASYGFENEVGLGLTTDVEQLHSMPSDGVMWRVAPVVVTEGSTGASPQPTTLESAARREAAMVKGAMSGTRSGRAPAADTSTEKVSLSALKPNEPTGESRDGTTRRREGGWWRAVGGGSASWATAPKGERRGACTAMGGGGVVAKGRTTGTGGREHDRIVLDEANGSDSPMAEPKKAGYPYSLNK
jgi:hypothetical protein